MDTGSAFFCRRQFRVATCCEAKCDSKVTLQVESRAVAEQDVLHDAFAAGCRRAYSRIQGHMIVQAINEHV